MSKVALLADIHFGIRRNNPLFLESQLNFFRKQFIPYLIEHTIKTIYILGDVMDNRNNLNIMVLSEVFDFFKNDLKDFDVVIITGNHDLYYKTTSDVNSISFLEALPNVTIHNEIKMIQQYGKNILLVPWIVDEQKFITAVSNKNITSDYCFGHFEIAGFKMSKTNVCEDGLDPKFMMQNYNATFSGHFHSRSKRTYNDNFIQYVGSPCQYTRADIGDDRGFIVLDLITGKYEFVNNNESLKFIEIKYPDKLLKKQIQGNLVDVIVEYDNDYDETAVRLYMEKLQKLSPLLPATVKIENLMLESDITEIKSQSIEDLLTEYVDSIDSIKNKPGILRKLIELFKECSRGE